MDPNNQKPKLPDYSAPIMRVGGGLPGKIKMPRPAFSRQASQQKVKHKRDADDVNIVQVDHKQKQYIQSASGSRVQGPPPSMTAKGFVQGIDPVATEPIQDVQPVVAPVPEPIPPINTPAYPQPSATQAPPDAQTAAPPAAIYSSGLMPEPKEQAGGSVKPLVNPNSTQNHLQIAEIRDGVVIMNDGSFRSVVMVKSINFDLMSPSERDGVEYSYQGFLNSLYFPIQIFVRSEKVDIRPYIDKLEKMRSEHDNMLLALLMDDYIDYIDQLAAETNIMDKHFYVVVPFLPSEESKKKANPLSSSKGLVDGLLGMFNTTKTHLLIDEKLLEEAKAELRNRVQAVLAGLLECGVQGLPLDTQELIELYYDTYNPDTATRQHMINFDELHAPIVTKGKGDAPQPHLDRELV